MNIDQGSRLGQSYSQKPVAEINVTPMVDVMLVLLIIFMISAPLMQQGIQVNLPKTQSESLSGMPKQITIVVDRNRNILVNKRKLKKGTLKKILLGIAAVNPKTPVFVQADHSVSYGFVAQVIATIKKANLNQVGLVTQAGEMSKDI